MAQTASRTSRETHFPTSEIVIDGAIPFGYVALCEPKTRNYGNSEMMYYIPIGKNLLLQYLPGNCGLRTGKLVRLQPVPNSKVLKAQTVPCKPKTR